MTSRGALLFAPIGPNPASVTEAAWALHRQRGLRIDEVHVVTLADGAYWLEAELRGPGGALAELAATLGHDATLVEHAVRRADGGVVADDLAEDDAAAYRRTAWEAARACQQRAGDRPVMFLLGGGRRRTTTAYAATLFQLLARPGDELLDVRVSDRRVEGGTGFFFPEQPQRHLVTDGGVVDARTVEVVLVPVEVPRLAGVIPAGHRGSFELALAASRAAVAAITPPALEVDLAAGVVAVDGDALPLTAGQVAWYAALAWARATRRAPDDGAIPSAGCLEVVREVLAPWTARPWVREIRDGVLRARLGLPTIHGAPVAPDAIDEQLPKLRSDTRRAVRTWVARRRPRAWEAWLVPTVRKQAGATSQRLELPPERIRVVGG
jgi:CRISPR-associated protein (TIGR02584 family)